MFRLKNPTHTMLLVGATTALLTMAGAGSASAAPVTFTWNPNAEGITTTAPQQFTANDITTAEYGSIVLGGNGPGTFTNTGIVNLSAFTLNGANALSPGSTLGAGNNALFGTGYVLYATYQASGTTTATSIPTTNTTITSPITSFAYQLFLAPANSSTPPTFGANASGATVTNIGTPIELATGSEVTDGTATLTFTAGAGLSAGANVLTSFTATAAAEADGFFVDPPATMGLELFSSTTNTGSVVTTLGTSTVIIGAGGTGGGGNATFQPAAVPEPASLLLLGFGLVGLGVVKHRRSA